LARLADAADHEPRVSEVTWEQRRTSETLGGAAHAAPREARRAWRHQHAALRGRGLPALWFAKRERPVAHAKLRRVLDEQKLVEEILIVEKLSLRGADQAGYRAPIVDLHNRAAGE
jgi:hypothetical protein